MMNRDRGSNSAKVRKPRVKPSATSSKLDTPTQPPPLVRSHTLPFNSTFVPRAPRSSSLVLPDKEKARSDDGFHSDSDKDSNQSANSNISIHSNKSYLTTKTPSIKSNVVAKVRSKSSLGAMSDNSSSDKSTLDIAILNRQLQADKQAEEARKNRKIEDLEISIQSLTRFNAELEATNKKQAAEIQELRRKLRINNSLNSVYGPDDDDDDDEIVSTPLSEIDLAEIEKDNDARFRRICVVIDELIQDANEALAYTSKIGGSKVLTNAQLDPNNAEFQNPYMDESSKISDNVVLPSSPPPKNLKVPRELESNSTEKSNIDTITNETKSNSSVVNERTFINDPKIKLTTEIDNTNSMTSDLSLDEPVEEKNQRLQANLERARTVANELLSLEKQDNNNINNNIPHNSERKGLGLLLPIKNGHSPHMTHSSINVSDSPQPSPRMILLYELQESLGIGDAESLKYLKENRRSLPVMSSGRIHFNIVSPSEESQGGGDSKTIRRRSSPNFRTSSYPPVPIRKSDHITTSSLVKKDDSVLNSLPHGSDKSSFWLYLTTPFREQF